MNLKERISVKESGVGYPAWGRTWNMHILAGGHQEEVRGQMQAKEMIGARSHSPSGPAEDPNRRRRLSGRRTELLCRQKPAGDYDHRQVMERRKTHIIDGHWRPAGDSERFRYFYHVRLSIIHIAWRAQ